MKLRLPATILIGLALMLVLFWMIWHSISEPIHAGNTVKATNIQFTQMHQDTQVQTKNRKKVKRVPPPKAPRVPKMTYKTSSSVSHAALPPLIPQLALGGTGGGGIALNISQGSAILTNVVPLVRVPPRYPTQALLHHITGYVIVQFTITTTGGVKDAEVVKAQPVGVFNQAALRAVRHWRFKPHIVGGKPVASRAQQRIVFNLGGEQ